MNKISPDEYFSLIEEVEKKYPDLSKAAVMQIVIKLTSPGEEDE